MVLVKRNLSVMTSTMWPWSTEACCDGRQTGNHNLGLFLKCNITAETFVFVFVSSVSSLTVIMETFPLNVRQTLSGLISQCSLFFNAFFHYLKCHTWHSIHHTHLCVQHLSKCVLHGFFFPVCSWPCTVLFNCYSIYLILSIYLKSLEMLVWSMSTLMHLMSVWSYQQVSNRLVIQWCVHNASSISSCCWPLFRCYLSPLCSFMLFPVRQMDRKWDEKLWCEAVWGKMWDVPGSAAGLCLQTSTDQVSLCKALSFYLHQRSC